METTVDMKDAFEKTQSGDWSMKEFADWVCSREHAAFSKGVSSGIRQIKSIGGDYDSVF